MKKLEEGMSAQAARSVVKEALNEVGVDNKFSVTTTDFQDLARDTALTVTIKNWYPSSDAKEIKTELKERGFSVVMFEIADDYDRPVVSG